MSLPSHLFAEIADYSSRNYHIVGRQLSNDIFAIENSVYWCQAYKLPFTEIIPANEVPDALTWKEEYCRVQLYKHVLSLINNPTKVKLSYQKISILPSELKNMPNLMYLNCRKSQVVEIPDTLVRLTRLNCYSTQVSEIPDTLTNLTELDIEDNQINKIPNTLVRLTRLDCSSNPIGELPDTLVNLKHLDCRNTNISEIPDTLVGLIGICCDKNVFIPVQLYN